MPASTELNMSAFSDSYADIPEWFKAGLLRYVNYGAAPGGFIQYVIQDRLAEAVLSAGSDVTITDLRLIVLWFSNVAPIGCYGNARVYDQWVEIGGLRGVGRENTNA